ncbi:Uncharacterised protein [Klebsiella quasipneumoniae]|nr:Uncharacterised protein [Klebsiella quasipneumoniae]
MTAGTEPFYAGWRLRLTRPTGSSHRLIHRRPGKRSATGRWQQARRRFYAWWRLRLTRPTFVRPVVNLFTIVAETAGAGGLKIAETFPEGRGSPHGCGLRAVFCTDAASARPEACRDKSKGPRSGDFAGRSPGVQGAAATGRPLCAPCAIRDIAQKTYRERNLYGNHIEVVALPGAVRTRHFRLCLYFAGWRLRLTRPTGSSHWLTQRRPGKRSATGR